jgi:hypothetical protein
MEDLVEREFSGFFGAGSEFGQQSTEAGQSDENKQRSATLSLQSSYDWWRKTAQVNGIGRNISKPAWQPDRGGYAVDADLVADSSPRLTGRLKRFGRYDLNRDSLNLAGLALRPSGRMRRAKYVSFGKGNTYVRPTEAALQIK